MKQKIYLTLLVLIALMTGARAANTLTVGDVVLPQGGQADVVVNYSFTTQYYGFQIETPLFTGLTMGDFAIGSKPAANDYTLSHALLSSGTHRFVGYNTNHAALPTGTGELLHFTIAAGSSLAAGTYNATLSYVEFTNGEGKREMLNQVTFKVIVFNPTELKNQMTRSLAQISDQLSSLQELYDNTKSLYEQLNGCLPTSDYTQVMNSLTSYGTQLSTLQDRLETLASQVSSASPAQYYELNATVTAFNSEVSSFSSTMTNGIASLNETVKSKAARDLQSRLTTMGQKVSALGNDYAGLTTALQGITANVGEYYFEKIATDDFNASLAATNASLTSYDTAIDSLTTVYNNLVRNNSISTVSDAISFYRKFFALSDGYDSVAARGSGIQTSLDGLQAAYDQLEVNFPEAGMLFNIRPTDLEEEIQMGYKDDLGHVLTSGGIMLFEQVSGCDFKLFDVNENYVTASMTSKTLGIGTDSEAAVWTGTSLHNGNYLLYCADAGRYLAYEGNKVNSAIIASTTAHSWTISESNLDPLQAFINMLAEEEANPKENQTEPVDFIALDEEDVCESCASRQEPIVFPPVPYPVRVKNGVLPVPKPEGPRPADFHPIVVPQGSHVILDNVVLNDVVGGHHVIYVEGTLEVTVNIVINIVQWEWFIHVGPTGRVIWHYDSKERIKNEGTVDIVGGKMAYLDNSGTVNQTEGTITKVINRYVYHFDGGIINRADNYGTMNNTKGTIRTARNYENATWNMSGGNINNTVNNSTDTVFVNQGTFYFTGGIIRGYGSRLIYHGPNAFMRIDGGRFDFTRVTHYFIEAHSDFFIRGDYNYGATVPILLKPSVTIRLLYKWIYNFNVVFIGDWPTIRYPLFYGEGFTLNINHYQYIGWTLPNHRWRWHYSSVTNTIEPRDEEVWDEDDLTYYLSWLDTYRDSESASTEEQPQTLDLGGRTIVITRPVVLPVGVHVIFQNGSFVTNTTWNYNYMFQVPEGSSLRMENVDIDYSARKHYVVNGSVVTRYIFDVIGNLYIGVDTHIKGYLDSSLTPTDTFIPGAAVRIAQTGKIYFDGGWLENVVVILNETMSIFVTNPITHSFYVYLPTDFRYQGFHIMGPHNGYVITYYDVWYLKFFKCGNWYPIIDEDGLVVLDTLLGDVNGDGIISITDVMLTVSYIIGEKITSVFIKANADVNQDGDITIADVVEIVAIILKQPKANVAPNALESLTENMTLTGKDNHCTLLLNNRVPYTAFSMMVSVPDGAAMGNVRVDDRRADGHHVMAQEASPRHYNVVVFANNGRAFRDGVSPVLQFDIRGCRADDVAISDIQMVTPEFDTVLLPATMGVADGIDQLDDADDNDLPTYSITGVRTTTPTRGVYIRNGRKVVKK